MQYNLIIHESQLMSSLGRGKWYLYVYPDRFKFYSSILSIAYWLNKLRINYLMDNYREEDDLFCWQDEDLSGVILVSQGMMDKYKLNQTECYIKTIDQYLEDFDEEEGEDYRKWDGVIIFDHCTYVTTTDDDSGKEVALPYGGVRDEEFVCWWNDVPIELLKEGKDDVEIDGWSDG